jgi:mannosyltransferase OCH1-like enzyme/tetratricopeptide (TPR) repeat protein
MELIITELKPTICLIMIVKNESHIIKDTLKMLCSKIHFSYWVICDTGSTDNTCEIISHFFQSQNIPGELHNHEWKNFAHNRTLALQAAFNKSDFVFVFDADDEICGQLNMPTTVDSDGYMLNFGHATGISYQRVLLVNNRIHWEYQSVIHEYIHCLKPNPTLTTIEGDYYIVSGRRGHRSSDVDKYLKDAIILEEAYKEAKQKGDDLHMRYAFYCANSYKDCGKHADAIKWYKLTLTLGNWTQEKYMCCLNLYNEYNAIGETEKGIFYLVESFKYDTERMECVYILIKHYMLNELQHVAYKYYEIVKDFYEGKYLTTNTNGKLFVESDKANFFLPYYMILLCDKVKDKVPSYYQTIAKMFEIIFTKKYIAVDNFYIGNVLFNLQFFIEKSVSICSNFTELFQSYIDYLETNNIELSKYDFFNKFEPYGISRKVKPSNKSVFSEDDCKKSNKILFYTGFSNVLWNYTYSLHNSLGGSESAVINLASSLPKSYDIYIGGAVAEETVDNITYVNLNNLKNLVKTVPFHTVIVSRYVAFYEMFNEASFFQSYIWGHDINLFNYGCNFDVSSILTKWSSKISGCVCQTEWHKNLFETRYPELKGKIATINNGIQTDKFVSKPMKIANRFVYTSCSERGLDRLLELWPQIVESLPDAELFIASYNKFPHNDYENKLNDIIKKQDSVTHLGSLNKDKLYELMSSAEFWIYPTNFNETSCITAMEMLMSEVICVYYPLAGLINTLGDYGIPVERGNEIDAIMNLSLKRKYEIRKRGLTYALSCSWNNRADEWNKLIELTDNKQSQLTNIAIFNSCSFHYEMFGFILNYAKHNNLFVDIYTNKNNDLGWFTLYNSLFSNFKLIDICCLNKVSQQQYSHIFITTDNDPHIPKDINYSNVILINHFWKIRNTLGTRYLNCAPFRDSKLEFCYPVYPIFNINDKKQTNVITIVGGGEVTFGSLKFNIDIINRFHISNNLPITLNFICRGLNDTFLKGLNDKFNVNVYANLEAELIMNILKDTNYLYITFSNCVDKELGHSCSGSIQLAFNTLCKPIILKDTNKILNIQNCIEYTTENDDPIYLDAVDFFNLQIERDIYVNKFQTFLNGNTKIPKKIVQTWEHKNFEPEFESMLINSWKKLNPTYEYVLFDKNEREQFIKDNFDISIYSAYNQIIPGANKADLFRYCYLYINGGVCVDIDTLCIGKLDNILLSDIELTVLVDFNSNPLEGNHNIACGFIISVPKHPVLLTCINLIVHNIKSNAICQSKLDFTGPGILGRSVNKYLGNEDTSSFIGIEGIHKNIYFLKFEKNTEFVKDINDTILFQNKNGNPKIIELYNKECNKINGHTSWLFDNPIAKTKQNIALMVYGQFRIFEQNLMNNINALMPIFEYNQVTVFILSDKKEEGNYSLQNENRIIDIFRSKNINIGFIKFIEDCDISNAETEIYNKFHSNARHQLGIQNKFVPNLIYRKYLLNLLKNEYVETNDLTFNLTIYCRMFDMNITQHVNSNYIKNKMHNLYNNPNLIACSADTFFIGSKEGIDHVFNLSNKIKLNEVYHDDIWDNTDFYNAYYNFDSYLAQLKHTYSPEVQYVAHIFFSDFEYENIRVDYNNPSSILNKYTWYDIKHDPERFQYIP